MPAIGNAEIAGRLNEYADILEQQQANHFRITAYRRAATYLMGLREPLSRIYETGGTPALVALPNIGKGIASSIAEMLHSGRWARLERLRGALQPERLFQTVPGIGPKMAQHIHDELGIDTLEQLELAAHDGRLERVAGIGHGRAQIVRATLATMLARSRAAFHEEAAAGPDVSLLLAVDREYREKAVRGELPTIAPRRFNPDGTSWLPVLHTVKKQWHFSALYSNTARAHELGHTRDWVVIYFYNEHHEEGQHTVVTETRGPLKGRRVVRGLEEACLQYAGATDRVPG
jgi:putative hydrolase